MKLTEKANIYHNVWKCAYQRRHMYRGTPREYGEHATILMCLKMKDARWWQFDTEKPHYLR
jgi:hypothetical protein